MMLSVDDIKIRKAQNDDIPTLKKLLLQVELVHHQARPDLFRNGTTKYTYDELKDILASVDKIVFVAEKDNCILGYVFCDIIDYTKDPIINSFKSIYIDDLCVDEKYRHQGIGYKLYDYVLSYAKKIQCYNVTLNVWNKNDDAIAFYKKCGMQIQKIGMEKIL